MYLCLDEKSGLPYNENISKLASFSDVRVYGDAYVFKMEPNRFDELGRAKYIHMDELFVESAGRGFHAGNNLRKLLRLAIEEEEEEE